MIEVFTDERFADLALQTEKEENARFCSLRVFNGLEGQGTPDDFWGSPVKMPSWVDKIHNIAKGKRAFIFGTGPSLATQTELLKKMVNEECWTVNRMKKWGELPFKPFTHVITEPGPILEWGRIIRPEYTFPEAQNQIAVSWWPVTVKGWLWCPKAPDDIQIRWEGFYGLDDFLPPLPTGWASPLTISQLAAWMGYQEIYFLGIDTTQKGQAWDIEQGRTQKERNIRSILECFERAGRTMKRAGRVMADCTPGGRVNQNGCLPYIPLEEVLARPSA